MIVGFLFLLIVLGLLVHHGEPFPWSKNYQCYHAQRYRPGVIIDPDLETIMKRWDVPKKGNKSIRCIKDVSCQTFRCRDGKDRDLFVINACSETHEECFKKFEEFCGRIGHKTPEAHYGVPNCTTCYDDNCNEKELELIIKKGPVEEKCHLQTDKKVADCCFATFRYDKDFNKTFGQNMPMNDKNEKIFDVVGDKFGIENFETGKKVKNCTKKGTADCQTYRCKYANGDDHFVVNGCAENNNCSHHLFDQFCKGDQFARIDCKICSENGCNEHRINMQRPSNRMTTTTTTKKLDTKTIFAGGTYGTVTVTNTPAPFANSKLECLVKKICAIKDNKKLTAKLSRRFTFRENAFELDCFEVIGQLAKRSKMAEKFDKELEKFLGTKQKQKNKYWPVFVEDYIRAATRDSEEN